MNQFLSDLFFIAYDKFVFYDRRQIMTERWWQKQLTLTLDELTQFLYPCQKNLISSFPVFYIFTSWLCCGHKSIGNIGKYEWSVQTSVESSIQCCSNGWHFRRFLSECRIIARSRETTCTSFKINARYVTFFTLWNPYQFLMTLIWRRIQSPIL